MPLSRFEAKLVLSLVQRSGVMPRLKHLYKAVPTWALRPPNRPPDPIYGTWAGIVATGLDPARAGTFGGSTANEASGVGRAVLPDDLNRTWMTDRLGKARFYAEKAQGDWVILRIVVPSVWEISGRIEARENGDWVSRFPIPAAMIYFECGMHGVFAPLSAYNGRNAYIEPESESESDWDSD